MNISDSLIKSRYFRKDQKKFFICDKLIARGSKLSSSNSYAKVVNELANTGNYNENDVVGISAEGNRKNRIPPNFDEIRLAIKANVRLFITDKKEDRERPYNIGEREVASFLHENGYYEKNENGHWAKRK